MIKVSNQREHILKRNNLDVKVSECARLSFTWLETEEKRVGFIILEDLIILWEWLHAHKILRSRFQLVVWRLESLLVHVLSEAENLDVTILCLDIEWHFIDNVQFIQLRSHDVRHPNELLSEGKGLVVHPPNGNFLLHPAHMHKGRFTCQEEHLLFLGVLSSVFNLSLEWTSHLSECKSNAESADLAILNEVEKTLLKSTVFGDQPLEILKTIEAQVVKQEEHVRPEGDALGEFRHAFAFGIVPNL